jgi:hypothetical protein
VRCKVGCPALPRRLLITSVGTKRFLPSGRISGCYFAIGQPNGVIVIAERFVTAASIHEATGLAICERTSATRLPATCRQHLKAPQPYNRFNSALTPTFETVTANWT